MEQISHKHYMQLALAQAKFAYKQDEVPVGAVIVQQNDDGQNIVISSAYNQREQDTNPIYHAELKAIELASQALHRWRLCDCILYVTLEPCIMCAGAIINARIPTIVYGANDPKAGAIESRYQVGQDGKLNHSFTYLKGILETECSQLLSGFFVERRQN